MVTEWPRVDSMHPLRQQVSALNEPLLIWGQPDGPLALLLVGRASDPMGRPGPFSSWHGWVEAGDLRECCGLWRHHLLASMGGGGTFFLLEHTCIKVKDTVHGPVQIQIQIHSGRIQRTTVLKTGPSKTKNYNQTPRTFCISNPPEHDFSGHPLDSIASSPSSPAPPELHRHEALRRVEVDTHPNGWYKGIADSPSTGAAPQAPTPLDQSSPPTILGGNPSSIHSPTIRQTHSCRCIFGPT